MKWPVIIAVIILCGLGYAFWECPDRAKCRRCDAHVHRDESICIMCQLEQTRQ